MLTYLSVPCAELLASHVMTRRKIRIQAERHFGKRQTVIREFDRVLESAMDTGSQRSVMIP
jgi:hypothetical protein